MNFGPRTGVAWDVTGTGNTVVRGGYGLFYGHIRMLGTLGEFQNFKRFALMVNYRGSTGYGQGFSNAIARDQNGLEAKDVLAGVDAALSRHPWIDPNRLGVEGQSTLVALKRSEGCTPH